MKILFDFLPILLFFATFKWADGHTEVAGDIATRYLHDFVSGGTVTSQEAPMLLATVVAIVATLGQVLWLKVRGRKVDAMLWVSLALVSVMGGATVWFHNETFIKWKPSALYWVMALVFWGSQALLGKNLLRSLMGEQLELPAPVWHRLNFMWVGFFSIMGLLNLYVAYSFSTEIWVNFKLLGGIGLMVLFTLAQAMYLSRYLPSKSE